MATEKSIPFAKQVKPGLLFSRLTVTSLPFKKGESLFCRCQCECGNQIEVYIYSLKYGLTKSCGCLMREVSSKKATIRNYRHGMADTPEYSVWAGLKIRCNDETDMDYGGRGIQFCERWENFEAFFADMGPRPSPKHSIERKDTNGDYCPENCIWATAKEQSRNKRNNRLIEYNGMVQCLTAWADELKIGVQTLWQRLKKGQTIEEAFSTPVRKRRCRQPNNNRPQSSLF
jgi:hypothetical protein